MHQFTDIAKALGKRKFLVSDEIKLQLEIFSVLQAELPAYEFVREKALEGLGKVDFYSAINTVAIEVKVNGSPMAIYRQLKRYANCKEVTCIVLLTSKAMSLPTEINGKPTFVINLNKAWL